MSLHTEPQVGIEPTTARTNPTPNCHSPYIVANGSKWPPADPKAARIGRTNRNVDTTVPRGAPAKFCRRCESIQPAEKWGSRTRRGKVTAQPYCKPCMVSYHAEWRSGDGREKFAAGSKASKQRYPEREAARHALRRAVESGRVERGTACEVEGAECSGLLEAHHDDYSKPLEVRWVCRGHHRQLDRQRQANESAASRPQQRGGR